jgi:hypothetical protein
MTMTSIERVRSLADVGLDDIALVGKQGGNARDIRAAGFDSFVGIRPSTPYA